MKEGNKIEDYLANIVIDKSNWIFKNLQDLEATGRQLVNSDKLKCLYRQLSPSKG